MKRKKEMLYYRARFYQPTEDHRPITFPPPGPYWCSGYRGSDDAAILIAYVTKKSDIKKYWPEALECEFTGPERISFSERFPQPSWWGA